MGVVAEGGALFLVRFGVEVTTKARGTRRRFQKRLRRNLEDAARSEGVEVQVEDLWSRFLVTASSPRFEEALARVHGVSSFSQVRARIPAELTRIVEVGEAEFSSEVNGRTFAVRARRSGRHAFNSQNVREDLGAALLPYSAGVNLDHPEVTVSVEVRDREAFLFSGRTEGPGGLPLGVQGKAVCLISGGFDSAVAAWLLLRRGVSLEYVFCNLGGAAYERAVLSVAKVLADRWSYGDHPRIHVVDFEGPLEELRERVTGSFQQVILKRLMYRTADAIARECGAEGVVTGESLGQVSSQTLGNLRCIDDAAELPVLRPLLGMEKPEIIQRAHAIGTGPISAKVREYCAIHAGRPVTHARPDAVTREEEKLSPDLLDASVAERRTLDLRELDAMDLVAPYLFVDTVPPGAQVLDLREAQAHRKWSFPGSRRISGRELTRSGVREMEKERTYVLFCGQGLESADAAEDLQRKGFEAYAFRGGVAKLKAEAAAGGREPAE